MSPERLEQIRAADAESTANPGCPGARHRRELLAALDDSYEAYEKLSAIAHRAELLAEVERLTADTLMLKEQRVQIQDAYCVMTDYARAVEAERDEARRTARELRAYLDIWVDAVIVPGLDRALRETLGMDALPDWLTDNDGKD